MPSTSPYITACPVGCSATLTQTDILLREGPLLKCSSCGHHVSQCTEEAFLQSMSEFNSSEGTRPSSGNSASHLRSTKKILAFIQHARRKSLTGLRLLDVGCSSGAYLETMLNLGLKAEGIEPAEAAARSASEAGLPVRQGYLEEANYPDGHFEAITLIEVIEHLAQPLFLLRECHRILHPHGLLFIKTGNVASWTADLQKANWHYFDLEKHGGHISFFCPLSVKRLARATGFEVDTMITKSVSFSDEPTAHKIQKIGADLLNWPARLCGKGHDFYIILKKSGRPNDE